MEESDEQLVIAYRSGARDAFPRLLSRHLDGLFGFAFRLVGNREEAEDIVQETSVKAWKNIERFREGERWKTWIYAIARNTAIDHLRKKRTLVFSDTELPSGENPAIDNQAEDSPLPDEVAMRAEDAELLGRALDGIPIIYREVLLLYYHEGMTLAETATALARPVDTVKSQHRRAIILLRKRLAELVPEGNAPNYRP